MQKGERGGSRCANGQCALAAFTSRLDHIQPLAGLDASTIYYFIISYPVCLSLRRSICSRRIFRFYTLSWRALGITIKDYNSIAGVYDTNCIDPDYTLAYIIDAFTTIFSAFRGFAMIGRGWTLMLIF